MAGLKASLIGPGGIDLAGWADARLKELAVGVTAGVSQATDGLKNDLRSMISSAGFGSRLPNAIRGNVYPGRPSLHAAGFVYPRGKGAQNILDAFTLGVTIKSSRGTFLAIPTPEAGVAPGGRRVTPDLWEKKNGIGLKFVYRREGPSLLVADLRARGGKRGGFARPSARSTGRGVATVVIFILLPQVTLSKRLDPDAVAEKWANRIPDLIQKSMAS